MCLFTSARTFAIVFARAAGSEAMYCAGVLTFDGGFIDSSEVYHRMFKNQPAPEQWNNSVDNNAKTTGDQKRPLCGTHDYTSRQFIIRTSIRFYQWRANSRQNLIHSLYILIT